MLKNEKATTKINKNLNMEDIFRTIIFTISFIIQIILIFVVKNELNFPILFYSGLIIFFSAFILELFPSIHSRNEGMLKKEKVMFTHRRW